MTSQPAFRRVAALFAVACAVCALAEYAVAQAPLTLGGEPSVNPADFVVTAFATDLNFPVGMAALDDGSIVVAVTKGDRFFGSSSGSLVRLTDLDDDGISDARDTLIDSVPGGRLTSLVRSGDLLIVTGAGSPITIYRLGAGSASVTEVGRMTLQYPGSWQHNHTTLAVRETVSENQFELFFQVGSAENFAASTDMVELDSDIGAAGSLSGDAIHRVELIDDGDSVAGQYIGQVAGGLRNASGLAFHPESGDLYIAENGIDGLVNASEAFSADELNMLPEEQFGGPVEHFGFPETYEEYRTGVVVGGTGITPLVTYQPIPDPNTGDESEGPNQHVFSPPQFPAYLNSGLFMGFHGQFSDAGPANQENPLVFTDPVDATYYHIVGVNEPGVGHFNGLLARESELFVADMSSDGGLGTSGFETGVIYRIYHPPSPPVISMDPSVPDTVIFQTETLELSAAAFDVQDGDLGDQIVWSSTLDGQLGTGPTVSFAPASAGLRTITASVTDSQGAESTARIEVSVERAPATFTECPLRSDGPEDGTLTISPENVPLLDGLPIESGTEIAVSQVGFDDCSGVGIWEGDKLVFPIDGDDDTAGGRDGIEEGGVLEFSIWSPTSGMVYSGQDITVEWETGPDVESSGQFVPGAAYAVASMLIEEYVLPAPSLSSPADGATDVGLTLTMTWSSVPGAAAYQLQVDDEPSFLTPVVDREVTGQTAAGVFGLQHEGTYSWRVRSIDASSEAGEWSDTWTFTTVAEPFMTAPELIAPLDGATDLPLQPEFAWAALEEADQYRFQLADEASFGDPAIDLLLEETTLTLPDPSLEAGTEYFWRVSALAGEERGAWSDERSFQTVSGTGTEDDALTELADRFNMYPNPVHNRLVIEFGAAEARPFRVSIVDVTGRELALLVDAVRPSGVHSVTWTPPPLASGVYVVHLRTDTRIRTRTFVVLR